MGVTSVQLQAEGLKSLRPLLAMTDRRLYDKAQALGVKAAAKSAEVAIAKGITSKYTIPSGRIKKDISKPYFSGGGATILASRTPPTLNQYRFKPGRRGGSQPGLGRGMGWGKPSRPGRPATAQIVRSKPAMSVRGAFLAKGVPMIRVSRSRGSGSLRVLKGPSVARIFAGRGVFSKELQRDAAVAIDRSFGNTVEKVIRDAARGYGRG